ncbi:hypothetical protein NP236_23490, partial [Salmonella enterica]|nr:hypothetical protein [Salmonella enterica]
EIKGSCILFGGMEIASASMKISMKISQNTENVSNICCSNVSALLGPKIKSCDLILGIPQYWAGAIA